MRTEIVIYRVSRGEEVGQEDKGQRLRVSDKDGIDLWLIRWRTEACMYACGISMWRTVTARPLCSNRRMRWFLSYIRHMRPCTGLSIFRYIIKFSLYTYIHVYNHDNSNIGLYRPYRVAIFIQGRPFPLRQWCISPCFRFSPLFPTAWKILPILPFVKKTYRFSSAKISDAFL